MRKLYMIVFLVISGLLLGQNHRVSQKVNELTQGKQIFQNYSLFTKDLNQKTEKYLSSATDVTILELNSGELNRIMTEAPEFLTLRVPYLEGELPVKLYKQEVVTDNFYAVTESGLPIDYTPGQYYRGIVEDDMNSLVAISFFENEVMGVISTQDKGNVILGKSVDGSEYITYSDIHLLGETSFECAADELDYNREMQESIGFDPSALSPDETDYCVGIYYEVAYRPYLIKNKDFTATLDWMTGIQNNIGTLYDNDGIDIAISSILIWTFPDPYTSDYGENLYDFADKVKDFDGDLAHLVTTPSTTSVAFLDSLCGDWNYAYSAIDMNYGEVPVYSWTIMAMSHEMGHSMGSPHTHACAWNGDNTAIDGCGPAGGYSEGCDGPIPPNGGTIMSYCHLLGGVGINFVNGFGEQPSALIRNTINSKSCLSSDCVSEAQACTYAMQDVKITYTPEGEIQVSVTDNASEEWRYYAVPYQQGFPTTWLTTDAPEFDLSDLNLEDHTYYDLYIQNVCETGTGGLEKHIILTGNFCDGTPFTDTGGPAYYSNDEYFVKTFYPSAAGDKVSLDFEFIGLHNQSDFLYVYDGDSEQSPLFEGGTLTGNINPGPMFASTHPSGAITVKFLSDYGGVSTGWEASVDCAFLDVIDLSAGDDLQIYPNPAVSVLYILSPKARVESIQLTDITGRRVLAQSNFDSKEGSLDLSGLAPGVYILTMKTDKKTVTKKVVKK